MTKGVLVFSAIGDPRRVGTQTSRPRDGLVHRLALLVLASLVSAMSLVDRVEAMERCRTTLEFLHGSVYAAQSREWRTCGGFRMVFQNDGNLVVYGPGRVVWSSGTSDSRPDTLVFQPDGNLVMYRDGRPVWSTRTAGVAGARLHLTNDGRLVLTDRDRRTRWASHGGR